MKNWLLITIFIFSFAAMSYDAFCEEKREWHEDCIWECIEKGNDEMTCLQTCEEIAGDD